MYKILFLSLLWVLPISQAQAESDTAEVNAFLNEIHEEAKDQPSTATALMYENFQNESSGSSSGGGSSNTPSIAAEIKESDSSSTATALMYEKF